MTQHSESPIRTRRDGSIDTAFYMQRGRQKRSEQLYAMARGAAPGKAGLRRGGMIAAALTWVVTFRQTGG